MLAVRLKAVSKRFGRLLALDGVSLELPQSGIHGLVGPNGAGKTTLLRIMAGQLAPSGGTVVIRGRPIRPGRPTIGQLSLLPQDAALRSERRVEDELRFLGRLQGLSRRTASDRTQLALEALGLSDVARRTLGGLSHGQRRRVGVAQALLGHDEVIALDEPTSGVDPRSALELRRHLAKLSDHRCILLSSHDLAEVEAICQTATILHRGRVVAQGSTDSLVGAEHTLQLRLSADVPLASVVSATQNLPSVEEAEVDGSWLRVRGAKGVMMDDVTSEVVRELVLAGVKIHDVRRGRTLADAFMTVTE
ncbi:MAG: ABC transporter ATP-binding protein [Myxococcota bacterium]